MGPRVTDAAVTAAGAKPTVLCVVDRPGWAHDRKTDALARALSADYRIVKCHQADLTADAIDAADLVLVYYWLQLDRGPVGVDVFRRNRSRLLVGICSQYELDGAMREPGLARLAELPRAVFANNRGLIDRFEGPLGRRLHYTPNGVDTTFFHPAPAPAGARPLRAGWAGSLTNHGADHRGVHDVIVPAVDLVEGVELAVAAREEHWRDASEMRDFYHGLDVYVCASRSEGTPNPCLEAAACGLPILTTPVGNMPELIRDGENGFFIERTVASLAAKLALLRDDPARCGRMGEAARASIVPWDWTFQARAYDAMFRETGLV